MNVKKQIAKTQNAFPSMSAESVTFLVNKHNARRRALIQKAVLPAAAVGITALAIAAAFVFDKTETVEE